MAPRYLIIGASGFVGMDAAPMRIDVCIPFFQPLSSSSWSEMQ